MVAIEKSKKDVQAETKVMDPEDESFCGFVKLHIVDQDGLGKVTKGNNIEGVLHVKREGETVKLCADWTLNPLYYMKIERDNQLFCYGSMWYGEQKKSTLNTVACIVPKNCQKVMEELEKNEKGKQSECFLEADMPFLANSPNRLVQVKLITKEERYVTKVTGVELHVPQKAWTEWKEYRLRFWRQSKAWSGTGGEDKEDDDKKKDEDGKKKEDEDDK